MPRRRMRAGLSWLLPLALGACASYQPQPLPTAPDLAPSPARVSVPAERFRVPGLAPHPFDPAGGLDETDVVLLALANNPILKAARQRAGLARAQLLAAGLLPDPQLSIDLAHPTSGPAPLSNAFDLGLSEELQALVTREVVTTGARAHEQEVDLEILWKEWQIAQRARELYVEDRTERELARVLGAARDLNAARYRRDEAALRRGNVTLATVSADLTGLVDAEARLRELERRRNATQHALRLLLGLAPEAALHLAGESGTEPVSAAAFRSALAALPYRRADLLALRAGYRSQEERVREAVLEQFPALSLGVSAARDTGDVHTIGFGVTLRLPLFNRNRGRIAVQRATRQMLYDAYQARLDQAVSEAHRVWRAIGIMSGQLRALEERLPALTRTEQAVERSFQEGNTDAGTYMSLRTSFLAKRVELIELRAALAKAGVALTTLLGMPLGSPAGGEPGSGTH